MKVKIDIKLLEEQIELCDAYANTCKTDFLKEKFEGIANFLSDIRFLAAMGETVYFEAYEEEDK